MSTINAVHVNDKDTCVTVTQPCTKGDTVIYHCSNGATEQVTANCDVPVYHKIAISATRQGEYVYKYGSKIGIALEDIAAGDYVHIHNIKPVGFIEEA